jgi:hypothetical protein
MYEMMWQDLTTGVRVTPDFGDALVLHRLMDRIEKAALEEIA